jgi:hypothetical protein
MVLLFSGLAEEALDEPHIDVSLKTRPTKAT